MHMDADRYSTESANPELTVGGQCEVSGQYLAYVLLLSDSFTRNCKAEV